MSCTRRRIFSAAVRAGDREPSSEIIGDCLACLDQVVQWLDQIAEEDGLPTAPDAAAAALLVRFAPDTAEDPVEPDWLGEFLARYPDLREHARTAFRYAPDADCFFRGEDPVNLVAQAPEVLALEMKPGGPVARAGGNRRFQMQPRHHGADRRGRRGGGGRAHGSGRYPKRRSGTILGRCGFVARRGRGA